MTAIGKVELPTEDMAKITETMLVLAQQRDEAQKIAKVMFQLLDKNELTDKLADKFDRLPAWLFESEEG